MKLITIQVEDKEHLRLKTEAAKAGLSMKDYVLEGRFVLKVDSPSLTTYESFDQPKNTSDARPLKATKQGKSFSTGDAYKLGNKRYEGDERVCKHGMHPEFCKHAKPGKPCK